MKTEYLKIFFITWFIVLLLNQALIFGCFAPYCILAGIPHTGVIAFLFVTYVVVKKKEVSGKRGINIDELDFNKTKSHTKKAQSRVKRTKRKFKQNRKQTADPLKIKGDLYEKFIGKQFEEKGELVIYNGFIHGCDDDGVDIISISPDTKSIHLVQCKNWTKKPLLLDDVQNIYSKLKRFSIGTIIQDTSTVREHLEIDKPFKEVDHILKIDKSNYTLRKTLYVSSDKVVDLNIGKHLTLIKPTIFKYEDMKIVIKGLNT